jgi:lipopolysaccharide transport system permease protein
VSFDFPASAAPPSASSKRLSVSPVALVGGLCRHRGLIFGLARREVASRYRGSVLGLLWSFLSPLMMLFVYTFVFSVVFRARWNQAGESTVEFALVLFAGLMVFNVFAESINRAPGLMLANVSYVRKMVFPLEILPLVSMASTLFHFAVSFIVWLVFYMIQFGPPRPMMLLLPLVLLPVVLLSLGGMWLLASLGVYIRDASQAVGIATSALLFVSPIFYPLSALTQPYLSILRWNPLVPAIEYARDVLIWDRMPDPAGLLVYLAATALVAWLGFAWFQKTRKGFADVV